MTFCRSAFRAGLLLGLLCFLFVENFAVFGIEGISPRNRRIDLDPSMRSRVDAYDA